MMKEKNVRSWSPSDTEWAQATRCIYDAFGVVSQPDASELESQLRVPSRRVAVADQREIFGGCFAYDFCLSVPGGAECQAGGLAGVGISPVAQGRGGLRSMMQTHLQQSIEHGDAASVLMASESGIYQRYGYGIATEMVCWHLDTKAFSFIHSDTDTSSAAEVKLLHNRQEAIPLLADIHRKYCTSHAMEVVRDKLWWRYMLEPAEPGWVAIGEKKFIVVSYNRDHEPDGYALYSVEDDLHSSFSHGKTNSRVVLTEICTNSVETEIALFRYLVNLPWCRRLVWELGPVDPVLRHFMSDPRQLWQHSRVDMLWLRPLKIPELLSKRCYACDGTVVIDYLDTQFPELCGRWQLTVERGQPRLQTSTSEQHVSLGPTEFASIYAGTTRVAELASVGRISGSEDSVNKLDQLLVVPRPPFNLTRF